MLKVYEWNTTNFNNNGIAVLNEATEVNVQRTINGDYRLEFKHPVTSEKHTQIKENRIIKCEGQLFRINHIQNESSGILTSTIEALHIYHDNKRKHIQYIKNYMGYDPRVVVLEAFKNTCFNILTRSDVESLGMEWIDGSIDFWEQSKITPQDVIETVIKNAGFGELYIDNYNIAIVKRLGIDKGFRLDIQHNLGELMVERDITSLVTRLYPYGQNDLHIGSVNEGLQYIDSPNISKYGCIDGFIDYNDINIASILKSRGEWEFDAENEQRIDEPILNISGKIIDLAKLSDNEFQSINLGDTVHIYSDVFGVNNLKERIIQIKYYPYEPTQTEITIGKIKEDLWFYLKEMNNQNIKYDKVSNTNGDVKTNYLQGNINTDINNIFSENERFKIIGDLLTVRDDFGIIRQKLGLRNGGFIFEISNEDGQPTVYIDSTGDAVFAGNVNTQKNAIIGNQLILQAGAWSSDNNSNGIYWYTGNSIVSKICCWSGGNISLVPGNNLASPGKVYIGSPDAINAICTKSDLTEFESTIKTWVEDYIGSLVTSAVSSHNHGIADDTQLALADGGSISWVSSGNHSHEILHN